MRKGERYGVWYGKTGSSSYTDNWYMELADAIIEIDTWEPLSWATHQVLIDMKEGVVEVIMGSSIGPFQDFLDRTPPDDSDSWQEGKIRGE